MSCRVPSLYVLQGVQMRLETEFRYAHQAFVSAVGDERQAPVLPPQGVRVHCMTSRKGAATTSSWEGLSITAANQGREGKKAAGVTPFYFVA